MHIVQAFFHLRSFFLDHSCRHLQISPKLLVMFPVETTALCQIMTSNPFHTSSEILECLPQWAAAATPD